MKIRPIRNEQDYQNALERLEDIFDAEKGTEEGDELEILSILIDNYENEHFPIGMPDPIEAIKFRMEQMGMKQKDFGRSYWIQKQSKRDFEQEKKAYFGDGKKVKY